MKKRIICLFITICMAFSFLPVISPPAFAAITAVEPDFGDGTADNPYQIATPGNLAWFRDNINNGTLDATHQNADLTQNITINDGEDFTHINSYSGTFDGQNHTIYNLNTSGAALFARITSATIKNLHIESGTTGISGQSAGGIVSNTQGTSYLQNSSFKGKITGNSGYVGGLVGHNSGTLEISDCWVADSTIFSGGDLGSIIGTNWSNVSIKRCYARDMRLSSNAHCNAAFVARSYTYCLIEDCYFTGTFSGNSDYSAFGWLGTDYDSGNWVQTIRRVHIYSSNYSGWYSSVDNAGSNAGHYPTIQYSHMLRNSSGSEDSRGNSMLSKTDFKDDAKFSGWEFGTTWSMGENYPVLMPSLKLSSKNTTLKIEDTNNVSYNLSDYLNITMSEDYTQTGRFTYDFESGDTVTRTIYDAVSGQSEVKDLKFATIKDDMLNIDATTGVGVGIYPLKITATDTEHEYQPITISLNVIVYHYVPEPTVLSDAFSYSRSNSLKELPLPAGWKWTDPSICPKDKNEEGYEAYYKFDEDEICYDYAAVEAAAANEANEEILSFEKWYDEEDETKVIGIKVKLKVPVTQSDESPWDAYFTVIDDDTGDPIEGAEIYCDYDDEFPYENGHKSDKDGVVGADMSQGEHNITISADGYQTKEETVTIKPSNTQNNITVELVPERYTFTVPTVKLKDTEEIVPNAKVTITKLSTAPTGAWYEGAKSVEVDAGSKIDIPDGDFSFRSSTYGYTTDDITYVRINRHANDSTLMERYYTDSEFSALNSKEQGSVIHVVKMTEPVYNVRIERSDDRKTYTAKVTLSNIQATYGAFGLRYDPDLFTLDNVSFGSDIYQNWNPTVEKVYEDAYGEWKNENGYYAFVWTAGNDGDAVLNTEPTGIGGTKDIVSLRFKLNDPDGTGSTLLADQITADSFGIMPWPDTKAAAAYAKDMAEIGEDPMFWTYWRPTDADNYRRTLKEGRIEESKSVVNGIDMGGFFQAAVNSPLAVDTDASFYDVMTVLEYGFQIRTGVFRFHVTDRDSGEELENARIRLFDTGTKFFGSEWTNEEGRANLAVDTSGSNGFDFTYEATRFGYWAIPISGLVQDRPGITAETGVATEVEVKMEQKIYHVPVIKASDETQVDVIQDTDLGGEKYAYNGREFHFRVKGVEGYKIKEYPKKAYVTIGGADAVNGVENLEVERDENGLFTLEAEYLNQPALSKAEMEALGYENVSEQPDEEGFRSYDVVITFEKFELEELEYIVEGMTNGEEKGTVEYNPNVPTDGGRPAEDGYTDSYVKVVTQATQYSDPETKQEKIADPNHLTGTFTFAAKDGYMVEKVYINGLRITTYDDLPGFTYSFGEVCMDCSIVVMFWDGETHSTDKLLTLVVGDYGTVDTTSPSPEEKDITLTRRVYLNPDGNLEFTAKPVNEDYMLFKVQRAYEGQSRVNITYNADRDGKYSVAPVEGESVTVYVTFRHTKAEVTPTVFVKSYIHSGMGVANPAGILIYNVYDNVEIDLTPLEIENEDWKVKGVMLSPYEDLDNAAEWDFEKLENEAVYSYDNLTTDIAIGSIFVEKPYTLQGYVDLSQGSTITTAAPQTGATVTFVRVKEGSEDGEEVEKQVPFVTTTTAARKNAAFTIELPAGTWNVYITKPGYVKYKISKFPFQPLPQNGDDYTYKFGLKDGDDVWPVVPYIGATRDDGTSVTLLDAANIKSGWRANVNEAVRGRADVDDDGSVTIKDMTYVIKNFNQRTVTQTYDKFQTYGSELTNTIDSEIE